MLNKVPEITLYFWVIKILCTTVGETAADLPQRKPRPRPDQHHLHHGRAADRGPRLPVPGEEVRAGHLLARGGPDQRRRHPGQRQPGRQPRRRTARRRRSPSARSSPASSPPGTRVERTLSVHTIVTTRREAFYWLAILFTFALGTSAGDLVAEKLELGYLPSVGIFAGAIAIVAVAHFRFRLNAILAFWLAYILTRPLGASIGDYLSQPTEETGLGLGTILTSVIFLSAILALVVYLAISKRDVIAVSGAEAQLAARRTAAGCRRRRARRPRRHQQDRGDAGAGRGGARARRRRAGAVLRAGPEPRPPAVRPHQRRHQRRREGARRALPQLEEQAGGGGRGPGRQQPQRLRRHRRGAGQGAATARSSSRRRPATSPTGCTSTCPSGSPTSATR